MIYYLFAFAVLPIFLGFSSSVHSDPQVKPIPFEEPVLKIGSILAAKKSTKLDQRKTVTRGLGSDVYAKAISSVVKVLTNEGHGTGVILSTKGFLLTNHHVVEGYDTVGIRRCSSAYAH